MKATRNPGERTITITGIPTSLEDGHRPALKNLPDTLKISITYVVGPNETVLDKAISLDNIVLPAIVEALNRRTRKKTPRKI